MVDLVVLAELGEGIQRKDCTVDRFRADLETAASTWGGCQESALVEADSAAATALAAGSLVS